MHTKKSLAEQFGISENTVYNTLKTCGLDTSKQEYSQEEIDNFFISARKMLEAGKKTKEVREFFQMKSGVATTDEFREEDIDSEEFASEQATNVSELVALTVAQSTQEMVQSAAREVAPMIPALIAHSIVEEMNSPETQAAFEHLKGQFQSKGSARNFLLQKMGRAPMKSVPTPNEYKQLPEALPENSEETLSESSES